MDKLQLIDDMISKADGEFRGGDPEEIRLKREEKEDEDLGKGSRKTQHVPEGEHESRQYLARQRRRSEIGQHRNPVAKAQPGEEAGAFRGGDPEEIRIKREEKMQEMEDSGELEDQGDQGEEPTQEEVEEAQQEAQDKKEDQGKSLVAKAAGILSQDTLSGSGALQVSPVDTFGDYDPRDANGTPLSQKYAYRGDESQKYFQPGPIRAGKNQHRNWSEVLGIRIPLTGDPVQYLRRFWKQGQTGEMQKEADLLVRSLEGQLGILWCWRPDFRGGEFYKGIGDAPAKGTHKYVKRWWEGGRWNYEYTDEMHPERHGIAHASNPAGYTMPIHPTYWQHDKTPTPEEAYNHSAHMQVAEGGSYPVQVWDKKANKPAQKILHMPGSKRNEEGNFISDDKGMPVIGSRSMFLRDPGSEEKGTPISNLSALHKKLTPITTEYDAYGDPWIHWKASSGSGGRPEVMLDPKSRMNKDHPQAGKWEQRTRGVDNLREWIANQQAMQRAMKDEEERAGDTVPPEDRKSAKDWEPTHHQVWEPHPEQPGVRRVRVDEEGNPVTAEMKTSNALERGDLGRWKWADEATSHEIQQPDGSTRRVVKKQPVLQFDSIHDRNKVQADVLHENYGPIMKQAIQHLKAAGVLKTDRGRITPESHKAAASLIHMVFPKAFERAANTYNPNHPSQARFSTHLLWQVRREMRDEMPQLIEDEGRRAGWTQRREAARAGVPVPKEGASAPEITAKPKPSKAALQTAYKEGEPGLEGRSEGGMAQRFAAPDEGVSGELPQRREQQRQEYAAEDPFEREKRDFMAQLMQTTTPSQRQKFVNALETDPSHRQSEQGPLYEHAYEQLTGKKLPPLGKSFSMIWHEAVDAMEAISILRKAAEDETDLGASPDMKYLWRGGEPGAYKYMWEDPQGNVVRGTNAPQGHPHHDPAAGPPQVHPHEPLPETAPHMFDTFGRKLHRPAPEGVETEGNAGYDPDVSSWARKYTDPETGNEEHIAFHRDRVKNHRYALNEDLRQVDTQLEKIRSWYDGLIKKPDLRSKAIGLMVALIDQGRALLDGLVGVRLKDVSTSGNTLKISYTDPESGPHTIMIVPDSVTSATLHALAQGKGPNDPLFAAEGQPVAREEVAQALDEKFGVTPKQFRVYQGTELFSKEFQRIVATTKDVTPKTLPRIADQAYGRVMRMLGHQKVDSETAKQRYVDPIVVEALFMAATHHHDPEINKSENSLVEKVRVFLKEHPNPDDSAVHALAGKLGAEVDDVEEAIYKIASSAVSKSLKKGFPLQGQTLFQGLPVSIENRKGSVRRWYDPHEKRDGTTKMHHAYGYIRGTKGMDGDHVDVYIGPDKNSDKVFVVHQRKGPEFKEFDEDKCMLGFRSGAEAKAAYLKQYDKPGFFGGMTPMSMDDFKSKVLATKTRPQMIKSSENPIAAHYAESKRLWSKVPKGTEIDHEGLPSADGPHAHLRAPIAAHDYAAHLHGQKSPKAAAASTEAWKLSGGIQKASCSKCGEMWGKCACSKAIEKSFKGSADTGPIVWSVTVTQPGRTPDEKMFGDWIHTHPMHEHDQHWASFKQATNVEDLPEPKIDREYAHGGDKPMEEPGPMDSEDEAMPPGDPAAGEGDEEVGDQGMTPPTTAKSFLDDMLRMVG